jgi:hypothetical protein
MATSTDNRRCEISVLVVIICLFSITVLTGDWITSLMKKFLMTRNLLRNILLRRKLLWLTWSSSLAQDVAIDTWNCCWKHVLHWSLVSSRLNLASGNSAWAESVRCSLFGLLREKRHHLIHFFIVNYWLFWLVCLVIRILIVTSRCTVIGKLGLISSTYSSDWFNVNPNLFTK